MKTLLITPYWYPWNTSGTMRWLHIGQHLDFDVLTSTQPRKGFFDMTLPPGLSHHFICFGYRWPAVLWGLAAIFRIPWKYDSYVITSPPESLLITAFILEKVFRKKVMVDMRDSITRPNQRLKVLNWLYTFVYNRMNHVVVAWHFIDEDKMAVHHGYDDITPKTSAAVYHSHDEQGKLKRYDYETYRSRLECGVIPDYTLKKNVDWENYAASSYPTIKKMGFDVNVKMHPETRSDFPLRSWEEVAGLMKMMIGAMHAKPGEIG